MGFDVCDQNWHDKTSRNRKGFVGSVAAPLTRDRRVGDWGLSVVVERMRSDERPSSCCCWCCCLVTLVWWWRQQSSETGRSSTINLLLFTNAAFSGTADHHTTHVAQTAACNSSSSCSSLQASADRVRWMGALNVKHYVKVKVKCAILLLECRRGALSPFLRPWARRW